METMVITTHVNADFDSLASMLAAKKLYPEALLVFPGSQEKNLRDFFIQSTLYAFEIQKIKNIDLDKVDKLILVDTRQKPRIGKFADIVKRDTVEVHIYDHHPSSSDDIRGHREFVKQVGSTTTILVEILKERSVEITPDEATVMVLGIYEETGSLTFSSTTEEDFYAAAFLLSKGANLNTVSDLLLKDLTKEQISFLNELIQSCRTYEINGIEIVVSEVSTPVYISDLATLVHKLRDIEHMNAIFVIARMEDRVFLIARSRIPSVNVGVIVSEFGGGGHPNAASATIRDLTLIQVREKLFQILEGKIGERRTAKDLMCFPVKSVDPDQTIDEAGDLMGRYHISSLPVIKDELLVGLISKQVVERARLHKLNYLPVKEYMSTDFSTVSVDTPFNEIKKLIIENNQRLLPVTRDKNVIGVITRTDLLRAFHYDSNFRFIENREVVPDQIEEHRKNLKRLIQERVKKEVIDIIREFGRIADKLGYKAYVVGGFVRDLIMRRDNIDIDIVIEGDGIEVAEDFARENKCRVRTHQKFGTAVVIFPDNFKVDVATARLEFYESPAKLPTVEAGSLKLDLYRRDFTINTLAIKLNPSSFGEIVDFFGSLRDIKEGVIRVIHNLSFVDDPTRAFRAIRFASRFNFKIGKHTNNLIRNAVRLNLFEKLSGKRILSELVLIFEEEDAVLSIRMMGELDLLKFISPSLKFDNQLLKLIENTKEIISWYELLFLDEKYEKWIIYLFSFTDKLSVEELNNVCTRLSVSEEAKKKILEGRERCKNSIESLKKKEGLKRSEIYHILAPMSVETMLYMMAKSPSQEIKRIVSLYITKLRHIRPEISGYDLLNLGIPPGAIYRDIFSIILDSKLDETVRTKEDEIELAKRYYIMEKKHEKDG